MSEKKQVRLLKKCTVLCLVMDIIITLVCLTIMLVTMELSATVVATLAGMWSVELFLSFLIKDREAKMSKAVNVVEEIIEEVSDDAPFGQSV